MNEESTFVQVNLPIHINKKLQFQEDNEISHPESSSIPQEEEESEYATVKLKEVQDNLEEDNYIDPLMVQCKLEPEDDDDEKNEDWTGHPEDLSNNVEFPADLVHTKVENDLQVLDLSVDRHCDNSYSSYIDEDDGFEGINTTLINDVYKQTSTDEDADDKPFDVHFLVKAANKKTYKATSLSCDTCSAVFRYQSTYDYHKNSQCGTKMIAITNALVAKNKNESFTCNVCYKNMCSRTSLMVHMRLHTGERPFSCKKCDRSFFQKAHLNDHTQKFHENETVKKEFVCDNCGALFSDKKSLRIHLQSHNTERPYECKVCHKRYLSNSNLTTHMFSHSTERQYSCIICEKSFLRKNNLLNHLKLHSGEKTYACSICDKRFYNESRMKYHKRRHTGDLKYSCEECGKMFACGYDLRMHVRTHTGEKPFACSICGRAFNRKSILETHMTLHTGRKDFPCPDCGVAFNRKSKLKAHLSEHTGEQYHCEICQQVFSCKSYLAPHLKMHKGEKPFVCSSCTKAFAGRRSLDNHMKKFHSQLCQTISSTIFEPVVIKI